MVEKNITTKIQVINYTELTETEKKLVEMAKQATQSSYTPYSHFNVGAALLLENGEMIKGSNQENAAFAGICAERSAIYNAGANFPGVDIKVVAVAAFHDGDFVEDPCPPCGVCRQAMIEFEKNAKQPIQVLLVGRNVVYRLDSVSSLLPLTFSEF